MKMIVIRNKLLKMKVKKHNINFVFITKFNVPKFNKKTIIYIYI